MEFKSRRKKLINVSLTLDQDTLRDLNNLVLNYKTISKTEIMRMAIEYCVNNATFKKILKEIDV